MSLSFFRLFPFLLCYVLIYFILPPLSNKALAEESTTNSTTNTIAAGLDSSRTLQVNDDVSKIFIKQVTARFKEIRPDLTISNIETTGVNGLYEISFDKAKSVYALGKGDFFIAGTLLQIKDNTTIDVKMEKLKGPRKALLAAIPREDMIVFSPQGEVKSSISIFTDVDCGYCRKLHKQVSEMNALGIEVKYLAYPRAGIGSPSYKKIASAWCANDKNNAMNILKSGQSIPINVCNNNPVEHQYKLGSKVGVVGTPTIFLEDGKSIPGYMPLERLVKQLGITLPPKISTPSKR